MMLATQAPSTARKTLRSPSPNRVSRAMGEVRALFVLKLFAHRVPCSVRRLEHAARSSHSVRWYVRALADEAVVVQVGGVAPSTARPTRPSQSPTRVSPAIVQVKALFVLKLFAHCVPLSVRRLRQAASSNHSASGYVRALADEAVVIQRKVAPSTATPTLRSPSPTSLSKTIGAWIY